MIDETFTVGGVAFKRTASRAALCVVCNKKFDVHAYNKRALAMHAAKCATESLLEHLPLIDLTSDKNLISCSDDQHNSKSHRSKLASKGGFTIDKSKIHRDELVDVISKFVSIPEGLMTDIKLANEEPKLFKKHFGPGA